MDNPDSSFTESEKKEEVPDQPDGVLKKLANGTASVVTGTACALGFGLYLAGSSIASAGSGILSTGSGAIGSLNFFQKHKKPKPEIQELQGQQLIDLRKTK